MLVRRKVWSNIQGDVLAFFLSCRNKRRFQRDVRTFEKTVLFILDKAVESITDILLLELEGCLDIFYD